MAPKNVNAVPPGAQAFFAYARERHAIFLRRQFGQLPPWTNDAILAENRFCNVFRELDKNTIWYRENVRDRYDDEPSVMLATVLFRMINRIETCDVIFNQSVNGQTTFERLGRSTTRAGRAAALKAMEKLIYKELGTKGPFVTGAYTMSSPPGLTKLPGMLEIVRRFMEHDYEGWYDVAQDWVERGAVTLEEAWSWFRQFDYLGDFHSYEIVTDLRHTYLLRYAPDIMTWANPGPGANRGANRVWGVENYDQRNSKEDLNEKMRVLLQLSRDARFWPQGDKTTKKVAHNAANYPKWEMRDVEHTLCEFDKYTRISMGQGKTRSKYRAVAAS